MNAAESCPRSPDYSSGAKDERRKAVPYGGVEKRWFDDAAVSRIKSDVSQMLSDDVFWYRFRVPENVCQKPVVNWRAHALRVGIVS